MVDRLLTTSIWEGAIVCIISFHIQRNSKMAPTFAPGARLSALDVSVIVVTAVVAVYLSSITWWWGAGLAFVVGHFFLFCNIVRMARPLQLVWATAFTALAAMTILSGSPSPAATAGLSLLVTLVVVVIELRKPSYHGLGWQTINPNLPNWWDQHVVASPPENAEALA